jgi:uncharacterized protein (TIGR02246 family)
MLQTNENAVRDLLERWAAAVRAKNMSEVLANHSPDFRMFDVPPPFESRGLTAYEETWRLFYSSQPDPVAFDIKWLEVVAGDEVTFAFAHMQCVEPTEKVQRTPLDFRLTVGLRKVDDRWVIMHEHHSVPAIWNLSVMKPQRANGNSLFRRPKTRQTRLIVHLSV